LSKNQKKKLKKKLKKLQESSSKSEAGQNVDQASIQTSADDPMDLAQSPILPDGKHLDIIGGLYLVPLYVLVLQK